MESYGKALYFPRNVLYCYSNIALISHTDQYITLTCITSQTYDYLGLSSSSLSILSNSYRFYWRDVVFAICPPYMHKVIDMKVLPLLRQDFEMQLNSKLCKEMQKVCLGL